jgi:DNA primase small subunit
VAKIVALEAPARAWARGVFQQYYRGTEIDPPIRLPRREFAAFPFTDQTLMRRHESFADPAALRAFLRSQVPRHVYYSSAYYRHPADLKMSAKEWIGADLIFDLDADHLRGAEQLDYAGQLDLVRRHTRQLLDEFILGDFGADPALTQLVFSGGRGYHIHVRDPAFSALGSAERRELVEYVAGLGFDPMMALAAAFDDERLRGDVSQEESAGTGRPRKAKKFQRLAPPATPGWRGRTTRAVLEQLAQWDAVGAEAAEAEMMGWQVDSKRAHEWARHLVTNGGGAKIRESLSLESLPKTMPEELLNLLITKSKVRLEGETDAPVTTDIHRLIRLPSSLHGGTGFRVVPLAPEQLDSFDPWREARIPVDGTARVTLAVDVRYPFPEAAFTGSTGETFELPTPSALFLVLRGEAALAPSPA